MKIDPFEKDKKKFTLRILIILIGAGLFVWGMMGHWMDFQKKINPSTSENPPFESTQTLWKKVNAKSSSAHSRGSALMQLTRLGEPTQKQIQIFLNSPDSILRQWGLISHTLQSNSPTEQLIKSAFDEEKRIREISYQNLKKIASDKAKRTLLSLKEKSKFYKEDQISIFLATFDFVNDEQKKEIILTTIEKTKSKNIETALEATKALARYDSRNKTVINHYRDLAFNSSVVADIKFLSLSFLSQRKDNYLIKNYNQLLNHKEATIREKSIYHLTSLCPRERWTWLKERILKEDKEVIQWAIVKTATQLDLKGAKIFLEDIKKIKTFSPGFKNRLDSFLAKLDLKKETFFCD